MAGRLPAPWTEKLFKVLVIGDVGVGKTSVVLQYVKKSFSEGYRATIGVDFTLKTIEWEPRTTVRLQLWDIAGQERFQKMSRVYYKGAMGALVVFDVTNSLTLEAASQWKQELDSKVCLDSGRPIPAVLLANKCDKREGDRDLLSSLNSFCQQNSFSAWFETSAKDNINIEEAGTFLVRQMMLCDTDPSGEEEHHGDGVKVNTHSQGRPTLCCWT